MHTFMEEYQRWLDSPALSEQEWAELNAISGAGLVLKRRGRSGDIVLAIRLTGNK